MNQLTESEKGFNSEAQFERNLPQSAPGGQLSIETARALQEVQGQIVMSKRFPRSIPSVLSNVLEACKRKVLAEQAMFSYPRGGQQVTGPSIRLAEELARNFGNLDYGIKELEQKDGESLVMAYCWDLENNVRQTKIFSVKHTRDTKKGSYKLTDGRDIYELVANNGARRLRACILGVIPGYIVDEAVDACEKTLKETVMKEPITDRVAKMLLQFKEFGVTKEMIEERLQHNIEAMNAQEVVALGKIFISLRDGQSGVNDWFRYKKEDNKAGNAKAEDLNERLKKQKELPGSQPEELPQ